MIILEFFKSFKIKKFFLEFFTFVFHITLYILQIPSWNKPLNNILNYYSNKLSILNMYKFNKARYYKPKWHYSIIYC